MVKRIFSILVLILFLTHFAGFYIYFVVQLKQVRQEMRSQLRNLPTEELELLTLTTEEFQKAKVEEHEVKVDGKMYDIARVIKKGNKIFVYCLHDKAEDNLLAFLDKILSLPLKDKKAPPLLLKYTSLTFLLPPTIDWSTSNANSSKSLTHYLAYTSIYFPSLDVPPPKGTVFLL